jgi:hypothetical protein
MAALSRDGGASISRFEAPLLSGVRFGCAAVAVLLLASGGTFSFSAGEAFARELPGQARVERLRACPENAPDDYAVLPDPPDSEDDGEDEDEDEDDVTIGPGIATAAGDCLFPSLEITSGNQSARIGGNLGKTLGPDAKVALSSQLNTTLGLTHVNYAWAGGLVTTVQFGGARDASLTQASIHSRYFAIGLMGSRFDVWAGDEFSFRAIAPSQTPIIASIAPWRSDTSLFVISAEDPTFRRITVSGYGPYRMPDLIARWAGRLGNLDLTLTGATHETNLSSGGNLRGYAGLASLRFNLPAAGAGSYVIAQASVADKALGFLGINTTSNAFAFTLPSSLNAGNAEAGKGVAGALVGFWQRSETMSHAGYITGTQLRIPGAEGGRILSWRTALNTTWTPFEGLSFALEAGYAQVRSDVQFVPSGNAKTLLITMTRTAM